MPISAAVRCVLYSASLTHRAGGCYPPLRSSGYNNAFVGAAICRPHLHTYAQKRSLADEARLLFALLLLFQHQGGDGAGREGKGIGGGAAVCLCQVVVLVGYIGGVAGVTVHRQGGAAGLIRVVDEHGGNGAVGVFECHGLHIAQFFRQGNGNAYTTLVGEFGEVAQYPQPLGGLDLMAVLVQVHQTVGVAAKGAGGPPVPFCHV